MTTPQVAACDRDAYASDGVVCIRAAIDPVVAERLLKAWDGVSLDLARYGLADTSYERRRAVAGAYAVKHLSRSIDPFRDFIASTRLPHVVGELVGASSVGFYWDQMFVKEPGTTGRTPWHNDSTGHPLSGVQIVGVWIALTPVSPENGLHCLGGSHRDPEDYWPATAAADHAPPPAGRRRCPDFELRRQDPSLRFLSWTMAPGDALFIHPRTLHFSPGNQTTDRRRVAYATWWHGDDVAWNVRPESEPLPPGVSVADAVRGARPGPPACPIVWRR